MSKRYTREEKGGRIQAPKTKSKTNNGITTGPTQEQAGKPSAKSRAPSKSSDDVGKSSARANRIARGKKSSAEIGGKSYGSTGSKNAKTAALDDYISMMAAKTGDKYVKGAGNAGTATSKAKPTPSTTKKGSGTGEKLGTRSSGGSTPKTSSSRKPATKSGGRTKSTGTPAKRVSGGSTGKVSTSTTPSRKPKAKATKAPAKPTPKAKATKAARIGPAPSPSARKPAKLQSSKKTVGRVQNEAMPERKKRAQEAKGRQIQRQIVAKNNEKKRKADADKRKAARREKYKKAQSK